MVNFWRPMPDLESNEENSSYEGLTQLGECTCEGKALEEPCEYCLKRNQDSSLISRLWSALLRQGPIVTANMLMIFSILLYSGNSVVIKKYIVMGGTGAGYLFLRSIITIPFFLITYSINSKNNKSILVLDESRKTNSIMLIACVSGAIRQSLLPFIMEGSEASTLGIVAPSVPMVTAVISHVFNVEKITRITVICLLIAAAGLIFALDLINNLLSSAHLSYYLLLLIPITKSFQVVFLKMSSDKFESLQLMANQVLVSTVLCLPMSIIVSLSRTGSISKATSMLLTFTCPGSNGGFTVPDSEAFLHNGTGSDDLG
ncbi:hypothetical protein MACK_003840 [Theileria orientalis]|uniref:EamA domain-containing protein n=1 Tax=Theileria orientalis TaxID=68886 RepID=A0A976SJ49_THEOR|nr:hypothetical protein MACK_003840 [Theileria orientalis]